MENRLRQDTQVDTKLACDFESVRTLRSGPSCARRDCSSLALWRRRDAHTRAFMAAADPGHKVVLVILGGVRHEEVFETRALLHFSQKQEFA